MWLLLLFVFASSFSYFSSLVKHQVRGISKIKWNVPLDAWRERRNGESSNILNFIFSELWIQEYWQDEIRSEESLRRKSLWIYDVSPFNFMRLSTSLNSPNCGEIFLRDFHEKKSRRKALQWNLLAKGFSISFKHYFIILSSSDVVCFPFQERNSREINFESKSFSKQIALQLFFPRIIFAISQGNSHHFQPRENFSLVLLVFMLFLHEQTFAQIQRNKARTWNPISCNEICVSQERERKTKKWERKSIGLEEINEDENNSFLSHP